MAKREQAELTTPIVHRDIQSGLLLAPIPKGRPVSESKRVVKIDNLPDSVLAHAYPTLLAAGASTAPPDAEAKEEEEVVVDDDDNEEVMDEGTAEGKAEGKAEGTSGLTAMLFGEPVHSEGLKCKAWGLYTDDAGAQAAKEALMKLPQFAELVEPVQARPRPRRAAPTAAPAAPHRPPRRPPPHCRHVTARSPTAPPAPPPGRRRLWRASRLRSSRRRLRCPRRACGGTASGAHRPRLRPDPPTDAPPSRAARPPPRSPPAPLLPTPLASPRPRRRCDEIVAALEARLDMAGACKAALGKVGEKCSEAERLQVT